MHDRPRGAYLVFSDSAIDFRKMAHSLKQYAHEILGKATDARPLLLERPESFGESTIELMTEKQPDECSPGSQGREPR